ncbi:MAG: nitrilase-related carbon-nitrogen hydrolase, partial [Stellaceae bacterium]
MSGAPFTAALIQFTAGPDPEPNIETVCEMIRRARDGGTDFVMTPEVTNFVAGGRQRRANARPESDDPALAALRALAHETGIWLLAGSLVIDIAGEPGAEAGETRLANRSFLIDPAGAIVARYDKIHMFDVDLAGGESYRESSAYRPGNRA